MCATCGCGDPAGTRVSVVHSHAGGPRRTATHAHDHHATHASPATRTRLSRPAGAARPRRTLEIERHILDRNDALAPANRALARRATDRGAQHDELAGVGQDHPAACAPSASCARAAGGGHRGRPGDAPRRRADPVHRRAGGADQHRRRVPPRRRMLRRGLEALDPADDSVVFVENVGNLVCPALFDLGETARVVVISVTEATTSH